MSNPLSRTVLAAFLAMPLAGLAQDRALVDPDMKVLLDNPCVRMQFHDVAVGARTPLHSHPKYAVYVFNTYRARITLADGSQRISEHKAGDAFWNEASRHVVENIGDTPIHNLVVELKPGGECH
ncbi:hypothetical protein DT603_06330 [Pseudoxanthomonas gei]|uniref:Cupin domain-containing protein n=1 Tax=Pseudoxanthomonas gei TaxID=1383030 RepID=A0ABX0AAA1_9GAMM|nr:hypothetical protein [Pseudoxanthomonas gei]NDK38459.1 hypothetical protein [Pseudoxanthomonas gei]